MTAGRLDGRVVLVSGAARGQGEAEARAFVTEGASVVLGDVLDEQGSAVASALGEAARYVHLDVSDEQCWKKAVDAAVDGFGHLDGLVNNAGILRFEMLRDTSVESFMEVVKVNQVGVLLGMRAAVEPMVARGGGTIVNISSVSGILGVPGTIAYTATKFAIRGMTKVAAVELGPSGIRVNSIHPGGVDTPMIAAQLGRAANHDAAFSNLPLRRVGRPEEIARLALFLTSDESSYCTGAEFVADGGMLAGPRLM